MSLLFIFVNEKEEGEGPRILKPSTGLATAMNDNGRACSREFDVERAPSWALVDLHAVDESATDAREGEFFAWNTSEGQ